MNVKDNIGLLLQSIKLVLLTSRSRLESYKPSRLGLELLRLVPIPAMQFTNNEM